MNGNIKVFGFCNKVDAPVNATGDWQWYLLKLDRDAALLARRRLAIVNGLAEPIIRAGIFGEERRLSKLSPEQQALISKQFQTN